MKTSKLLNASINRKEIVMNVNKKMTKREFLSQLVAVAGASVVASQLLSPSANAAEGRRGAKKDEAKGGKDADLPMVEPGKGLADSLAYHHSHADADKDPKTDKKTEKGVPWEKRFCNSCSFYTGVGKKDGQEVGKCSLFNKQLVAEKGICNSWAKKG
jgi:hypothetical protein